MTRRSARLATLLALLAAAACGPPDASPADAPTAGDDMRGAEPRSAKRPRAAGVALDPVAAAADAEIDALLAEWSAAADDAERARIDARVAAGDRVFLERLVARLAGPEFAPPVPDWVARFGEAAIAPLLGALPTAGDIGRESILATLDGMAPVWRDSPSGLAVCRAVLPYFASSDAYSDSARWILGQCAPAGSPVTADLARLWVERPEVAERAQAVLEFLGTDAGPAAPILLAAARFVPPRDADDEEREAADEREGEHCRAALALLRGIGSANPAILDGLRSLLTAAEQAPIREDVARVLAVWGDAAAAAAPDLIALLGDSNPEVRSAAAGALRAMPSAHEAVWSEVQRAITRGEAWTQEDSEVYERLARDPAFADRLAALLPSLPTESARAVAAALSRLDGRSLSALSPRLLSNSDEVVRSYGLWPWMFNEDVPLPDGAAAWLHDPDPWFRASAAEILARRGGATDSAIRDAAAPLLASEGVSVRRDAIEALGRTGADDPGTAAALVAILGGDPDDGSRRLAALALGRGTTPIERDAAAAVAWLRAEWDSKGNEWRPDDPLLLLLRALLRLPGGADELCRRVAERLSGGASSFDEVELMAVLEAGPLAAPLRPALAHRLGRIGEDGEALLLRAAIASIDGDARGIVDGVAALRWQGNSPDASIVRRLQALGEPGRRALVLAAGAPRGSWGPLAESMDSESMKSTIVQASLASPPDPDADTLRLGAVRLAHLLPPDVALPIYATGLADTGGRSAWVMESVAASLFYMESRAPGTVPPDLALRLLERAEEWIDRWYAVRLAGLLGPRGSVLVPRLEALRRTTGDEEIAAHAAVALWRITGNAAGPQETLRGALTSPQFEEEAAAIRWDEFAAAYSEMPLGPADLAALLAALRRSRGLDAPEVEALVPLLERFGPDAAPAVPHLRWMLAWRDDPREAGDRTFAYYESPARVLAAVGTAARPALPDLRKCVAEFGDPRGVFREAIRRLESAPR